MTTEERVDPQVRKKVLKAVKNVWRASLTDLCGKRCKPEFIAIVERGIADNDVLEEAVNEVVKALCPFPAVRISPWFWETHAGRIVAWAQWKLYGHEALTPSQAARLFWGLAGRRELNRVVKLIQHRKLTGYFNPTVIAKRHEQTGRTAHSTYVRRSQVLHLIEIDDFNPPKNKPNKVKVYGTDPQQFQR